MYNRRRKKRVGSNQPISVSTGPAVPLITARSVRSLWRVFVR